MGAIPRRTLEVVLLKPSKYDDDGYVIRHWRGVLPSNTLGCLYSLTEDLRRRRALGEDVAIEVRLLDEAIHRIEPRRVLARGRGRPGWKTVVCLAAVQTNMYPRACDLALRFRAAGTPVLIGGFHVSGAIALFHGAPEPPEIRRMIDAGVTIVKGEVEESWESLLRDVLEGRARPVYDVVDDRPDLRAAPIPFLHKSYMRRFAYPNMGTIDCGRGCPFNCSFCTIINVQGKKMRERSPDCIAEAVRNNYRHGVDWYFFTDDNFARNPEWPHIFDRLIELREREGVRIDFMMQVDVLSYKIKGFIEKAQRAGCSQVFIGMETINQKNLQAAAKTQNKASDYANLMEAWRAAEVSTHVGYIIGFPFDTPASVRDDVERLKRDVRPDMASFFMLTPLPGSRDHYDRVVRGEYMDPDLNRFDSFHPTTRHPAFTDETWLEAYHDAWRSFYSLENMKAILGRASRRTYWGVVKNILWYRSAMVEGEHPMISGFFRLKDRIDRRPGLPIEGRLRHLARRARDVAHALRGWWALGRDLREAWSATRIRGPREEKIRADLERVRAHGAGLLRRVAAFVTAPVRLLREARMTARFASAMMAQK